ERGRDVDLPRTPCTARTAGGLAHVRRGRVRDLAPTRRTAAAFRTGPAPRTPARVPRVFRFCAPPACAAWRAQDAGARAAARIARLLLRRRQRRCDRDRCRAQG